MSNDPYPRDPLQVERDRIDFELSQLNPLIRSAVRQRILENEDMRQHDAERRQADKERLRKTVRVRVNDSGQDRSFDDAVWDIGAIAGIAVLYVSSAERQANGRRRTLAAFASWATVEGPNWWMDDGKFEQFQPSAAA